MAPAYQSTRETPLNLPAFPSCLRCHVSGMRAPLKGTENRYPTPAFLRAGVSCERCHGPGAAHVGGAPGAIVNPAKLSPERRDAVCMQCHLEGKVAIERPGRHAYDFRPGESLSDYMRYYVLADGQAGSLGGVSQVEAMARSMCKRESGDAMSCTSCHDPHYEPPPKSASPTIATSACPAMEPTLQTSTTPTSQTACDATCRPPPAAISRIPRSPTIAFLAVPQRRRGCWKP